MKVKGHVKEVKAAVNPDDLTEKYSGLRELMGTIKQAVVKPTDANIDYEPRVEMTICEGGGTSERTGVVLSSGGLVDGRAVEREVEA